MCVGERERERERDRERPSHSHPIPFVPQLPRLGFKLGGGMCYGGRKEAGVCVCVCVCVCVYVCARFS